MISRIASQPPQRAPHPSSSSENPGFTYMAQVSLIFLRSSNEALPGRISDYNTNICLFLECHKYNYPHVAKDYISSIEISTVSSTISVALMSGHDRSINSSTEQTLKKDPLKSGPDLRISRSKRGEDKMTGGSYNGATVR
ncbi:hypothetical protein KQX54_004879 [Cotesia glomerata]|uniref:Uncharacterized protein n=1 Tax=Cotesia glomerata TaxID=32391 RepID=A0AAV7ICV8_COTGL|nr:hypothetical protein KQX54_004879 [Cotesia glomerata]